MIIHFVRLNVTIILKTLEKTKSKVKNLCNLTKKIFILKLNLAIVILS